MNLSDHLFKELEILSGELSQKEIDQYNDALEQYEADVAASERLGFNMNTSKPQKPDMKISYQRTVFNFGDKIITQWKDSWDTELDIPIVIVDYYTRDGMERSQINVKSSYSEFVEILKSVGANFV